MRRRVFPILVGLGLTLAGSLAAAPSAPPGTVVIGQVTCFRIRVPDRDQSVQSRVDHIQDVAAKFLGGGPAEFSIRPVGERRHIDVNGEFLVAVTPEDAAATGHKAAESLALIWRDALERAFQQSSARPVAPTP